MKKAALMKVLVLAAAILAGSALAAGGRGGGGHGGGSRGGSHSGSHQGGSHHGGHSHSHSGVGVYFGAPAFWYGYYDPWLYYPGPYYYPRYAPAVPSEYVDRGSPEPAAEPELPQGYWYYCAGSQAYYPYVNECPGGWQPVSPIPPDVIE